MQSDFKDVHFEQSYGNFRSPLRHASDRSATFLTVLAGRTVKKSPSPIGPGFESRRRFNFSDRSIGISNENYSISTFSCRYRTAYLPYFLWNDVRRFQKWFMETIPEIDNPNKNPFISMISLRLRARWFFMEWYQEFHWSFFLD